MKVYSGFSANIGFHLQCSFLTQSCTSSASKRSLTLIQFKFYAASVVTIRDPNYYPFYVIAIMSAFASAIAAWLANPFDVVKTQYQVQSSHDGGVLLIVQTEGLALSVADHLRG
jgi:Mitochondrial carrier protein